MPAADELVPAEALLEAVAVDEAVAVVDAALSEEPVVAAALEEIVAAAGDGALGENAPVPDGSEQYQPTEEQYHASAEPAAEPEADTAGPTASQSLEAEIDDLIPAETPPIADASYAGEGAPKPDDSGAPAPEPASQPDGQSPSPAWQSEALLARLATWDGGRLEPLVYPTDSAPDQYHDNPAQYHADQVLERLMDLPETSSSSGSSEPGELTSESLRNHTPNWFSKLLPTSIVAFGGDELGSVSWSFRLGDPAQGAATMTLELPQPLAAGDGGDRWDLGFSMVPEPATDADAGLVSVIRVPFDEADAPGPGRPQPQRAQAFQPQTDGAAHARPAARPKMPAKRPSPTRLDVPRPAASESPAPLALDRGAGWPVAGAAGASAPLAGSASGLFAITLAVLAFLVVRLAFLVPVPSGFSREKALVFPLERPG